jgi:predicted component of viral defense system (DUF524 family)
MGTAVYRAELVFRDHGGRPMGSVTIFSPRDGGKSLVTAPPHECAEFCEEPVQLLESAQYEYAVEPATLMLRGAQGLTVVRPSANPAHENCGVLEPGLRVGRLALELFDASGRTVAHGAVEVRSRKLTYRSDMRRMLADISAKVVELAYDARSPVTARALPDPERSASSLHQQFCFLKGILDDGVLDAALHCIAQRPHERLEGDHELRAMGRTGRLGGRALRELAMAGRRQRVPIGHPLDGVVVSLPAVLQVPTRRRSLDTPENRFVKFVLAQFIAFLGRIRGLIATSSDQALVRLVDEVARLSNLLQTHLSQPVFQAASDLDQMPLASPVLQQRSGYREVLQAWLRFDVAARLVWTGADDVFAVGQQDVATLYEYWVFFQLLDILQHRCKLVVPAWDVLLSPTEDRLGLRLKTGRHLSILGEVMVGGTSLCVRFDYNRTFRREASVRHAGTWTRAMRPDFTISLWPSDVSESAAVADSKIFYVHFDAKYRIEAIRDLFGDEGAATDTEVNGGDDPNKTVEGRYLRADLLKMHAYNDAIRQSAGAFVIYPGSESASWTGFQELLPGLGAFVLRPGVGSEELGTFIDQLVEHAAHPSVRSDVARYRSSRYGDANSVTSTRRYPSP